MAKLAIYRIVERERAFVVQVNKKKSKLWIMEDEWADSDMLPHFCSIEVARKCVESIIKQNRASEAGDQVVITYYV